jgi:hypothetical protein
MRKFQVELQRRHMRPSEFLGSDSRDLRSVVNSVSRSRQRHKVVGAAGALLRLLSANNKEGDSGFLGFSPQ